MEYTNYFINILEDEYADLLREKIMLSNCISRLEESKKYNFSNLITHYRRQLIEINNKMGRINEAFPKISNGQTLSGSLDIPSFLI